MIHRLFVAAAILASSLPSCCAVGPDSALSTGIRSLEEDESRRFHTADSPDHGPSERVVAIAGGDVILSCSFNISGAADFPTVEWSKRGLQPDVVFVYRDGCEMYEMRHPSYQYRASLVTSELKLGNVSLHIGGVRLSDAGTFRCQKLWPNNVPSAPPQLVELVVVAVTEPKLLVVSMEGGGVTLQCEASCWLPEPEVRFVDDRGNEVQAEEPIRRREASGCYSVMRTATLRDVTSRMTCIVHQPESNQTREVDIFIPVDCMRSCILTSVISYAVMIVFLLMVAGCSALYWKIHGKSANVRTLLETRFSHKPAGKSENRPLLSVTDGNAAEQLKREVANLWSKLREKEETICQLQTRSRPPVLQLHQPNIPPSPARSDPSKPPGLPQNQGHNPGISNPSPARGPLIRNHSSPDISTAFSGSSSASGAKQKPSRNRRSMSDSSAHYLPKGPKPKGQQVTSQSSNRFSVLTRLSEEDVPKTSGNEKTAKSRTAAP